MFKMSRRLKTSRRFNIPNIHISSNIIEKILFFITLALAVNFVMNKQVTALLSLFFIAGIIYYFNKNVTTSLLISIIITNLLLAINYLEPPYIEKLEKKEIPIPKRKVVMPEIPIPPI